MNTSRWIPYDSVAPILFVNPLFPDAPFFSGTGFFVRFPPFPQLFFATGRHCAFDANGEQFGSLYVACNPRAKDSNRVPLELTLMTAEPDSGDLEDVAVFVVGETSDQDRQLLVERALVLEHQEDVERLLRLAVENQSKLRSLGYPGNSKQVDHDTGYAQVTVRARGVHGNVVGCDEQQRWFELEMLNWKEGDPSGFSGAPVFEFVLYNAQDIRAVPVGMLLTGSYKKMRFININVVTDLIARYLRELPT